VILLAVMVFNYGGSFFLWYIYALTLFTPLCLRPALGLYSFLDILGSAFRDISIYIVVTCFSGKKGVRVIRLFFMSLS
jgi:hypothetical protein